MKKFVEDIPLKPTDAAYDTVAKVDAQLGQFSSLPMLICWGLKDFVFDHHFLAEWVRRFPEAQVHRFEDAGHYILEEAASEVLPLVYDFLAAQPFASR